MIVRRRGIALAETFTAFALMAMFVGVAAQMFVATAAERREAERRSTAILEAANVAERASALGWEELTPERLAGMDLPAAVKETLPEATLKLTVEPDASDATAKRVRIEISWRSPSGANEKPVHLNYWVYAPGGGSGS
jgi:hypothetical protein